MHSVYKSCLNSLMAAIVVDLNKESTAVSLDQNNPRELNYVLCKYLILFNFIDYARLRLYDGYTTLSHSNQEVLESRAQSKFDVLRSWSSVIT